MEPFVQRLVDEQQQLEERLNKLKAFLNTEIFNKLSEEDRDDLVEQCGYMDDYRTVLTRRLSKHI